MQHLEKRLFEEYGVVREKDNYGVVTGTPIVFNTETVIECEEGRFTEVILPTAIREEVLRDCAFFFNHDIMTSKPHARTRNKSLRFNLSDNNVSMEADLNLLRSDSKDFYLAIKDGLLDGMSFAFAVADDGDEWTKRDDGTILRTIKNINYVQEVSGVNYPAYPTTTLSARAKNNLEKCFDLSLEKDEKELESEKLRFEKLKAQILYKI